jgi:hypothetical protein
MGVFVKFFPSERKRDPRDREREKHNSRGKTEK